MDLEACLRAAVAAPSIHNSQPWRFVLRPGGVDLYADRTRKLGVVARPCTVAVSSTRSSA